MAGSRQRVRAPWGMADHEYGRPTHCGAEARQQGRHSKKILPSVRSDQVRSSALDDLAISSHWTALRLVGKDNVKFPN